MNAAVRNAQRLFHKWPNFLRISHSFYRCKGNKTHEIKLEDKECIVVYVLVKGLIPIGWDPFPRKFEGYEVDVRECMPIKMFFRSVGSGMLNIWSPVGTLQSPVPGQSNDLLALTAGHVFLSKDETDKNSKDNNSDAFHERKTSKGYQQIKEDSDIEIVFGNLTINGGEDIAHADVAVVQLESPLTSFETLWNELGLTREPTFDVHAEQCDDVRNGDIVMKYGETTKITLGRVKALEGAYDNRLGFIEIESYKNRVFSEPGDSGAYVYVLNKNMLLEEEKEDDSRFTEGKDAFLIGTIHGGNEDTIYCTKMIANLEGLRKFTNLMR
ncbi:uncharacterized protein LOC128245664 [Mya arenaria]|uniref:uncharacterized protein LOC128245664 n=1 Tax=Mya arenaria TaxID=6604 RepID=UPI0022E758FF|nr:uncharacterized protein LOC128245664 [Mya arenaria]